jgi:hypothetical protein
MANYLPRFTIRDLILATTFLAVACAALAYPTVIWRSVLTSTAMLAFAAAGIVAMLDRGERQAWSIGYVACFVFYYLLRFKASSYNHQLPTDDLLELIAPDFRSDFHRLIRFGIIGHLLFSMLFAYFGGQFAGWVYRTRIRRETTSP